MSSKAESKAESKAAWSAQTRSRIAADRPTLDEMAAEARGRPGSLRIAPRGDLEILLARAFAAPADALFRAFADAALARRWLGGPELSVVEAACEAVPGGAYRYVLADPQGRRASWGGTFSAVEPGRGFAAREWRDPAWFSGEVAVTLDLRTADGMTIAILTQAYESFAARSTVLRSPMDADLAAAFERLDALLASA